MEVVEPNKDPTVIDLNVKDLSNEAFHSSSSSSPGSLLRAASAPAPVTNGDDASVPQTVHAAEFSAEPFDLNVVEPNGEKNSEEKTQIFGREPASPSREEETADGRGAPSGVQDAGANPEGSSSPKGNHRESHGPNSDVQGNGIGDREGNEEANGEGNEEGVQKGNGIGIEDDNQEANGEGNQGGNRKGIGEANGEDNQEGNGKGVQEGNQEGYKDANGEGNEKVNQEGNGNGYEKGTEEGDDENHKGNRDPMSDEAGAESRNVEKAPERTGIPSTRVPTFEIDLNADLTKNELGEGGGLTPQDDEKPVKKIESLPIREPSPKENIGKEAGCEILLAASQSQVKEGRSSEEEIVVSMRVKESITALNPEGERINHVKAQDLNPLTVPENKAEHDSKLDSYEDKEMEEKEKESNVEENKDKSENREEMSELAREMALFNEYEKENQDILLEKARAGRKRSFSDSLEANPDPIYVKDEDDGVPAGNNEDVHDDDDGNVGVELFKDYELKSDPGSERKEGEEDVCFVCCDGGELVVCDRRSCPKSYHVDCSSRGRWFRSNKGSWSCDWHYCTSCQKAPLWQCQTCPTSYCKTCFPKVNVFSFSKSKGLCDECRSLILIIETGQSKGPKGEVIDFSDYNTRESLFKEYWNDFKSNNPHLYLSFIKKEGLSAHDKGAKEHSSSDPNKIQDADVTEFVESTESEEDEEGDGDEEEETNKSGKKKKVKKNRAKGTEKEKHADKKRKTLSAKNVSVLGDDVDRSLMRLNNTEGEEEEEDVVFEKQIFDGWASPKLIHFLNERGENVSSSSPSLSFALVAKIIRTYIAENKLRSKNKNAEIMCDASLMSLFGVPIIPYKHLMAMLKSHILLRSDKKRVRTLKKDEMIARRKKIVGKSSHVDSTTDENKTKDQEKEKIRGNENTYEIEDESKVNLSSPNSKSSPLGFEKRNRRLKVKGETEEEEHELLRHNTRNEVLEKKVKKGKGKKDSIRANRPDPSEFAAITPKNLSLIYLRRALIEEMLGLDDFDQMAANSYVRIRIPSTTTALEDSYRLVRVTGVINQGTAYAVGGKQTNKLLLIRNNQTPDTTTIDNCSNQDFLHSECKKLRDLMKWGILERLTVGEIEQKAMELKKIKFKEWYEMEHKRLQNLRDRASDMGLKKELRENVEKIKEMESPGFKEKKLSELPEVDADPSMANSGLSDEEENTRKDTNFTSKPGFSTTNIGWAKATTKLSRDKEQEKDKSRYGFKHSFSPMSHDSGFKRGDDTTPLIDSHPPDSWRSASPSSSPTLNRARSISRDEGMHLPSSLAPSRTHSFRDTNYGISNWGTERQPSTNVPNWRTSYPAPPAPSSSFPSPSPLPSYTPHNALSSLPPSQATPSALVAEREKRENELAWFYTDPKGSVQGPFPITKLRQWSSCFPPDLMVWRVGQTPQQSILLSSLLKNDSMLPAVPPLQANSNQLFGRESVSRLDHFDQSNGLSRGNGFQQEEKRALDSKLETLVWGNKPSLGLDRNPVQTTNWEHASADRGQLPNSQSAWGNLPGSETKNRSVSRSSMDDNNRFGSSLDTGWGSSDWNKPREKVEPGGWGQNGMEDSSYAGDRGWRESGGGFRPREENGWAQGGRVHDNVREGEVRDALGWSRPEGSRFEIQPGGRGGGRSGGRGEPVSNTPCKFYKEGNCRKGDKCGFRHD